MLRMLPHHVRVGYLDAALRDSFPESHFLFDSEGTDRGDPLHHFLLGPWRHPGLHHHSRLLHHHSARHHRLSTHLRLRHRHHLRLRRGSRHVDNEGLPRSLRWFCFRRRGSFGWGWGRGRSGDVRRRDVCRGCKWQDRDSQPMPLE